MRVLGYVVSWNSRDRIHAFLRHLEAFDRPLDGLLVVDNGSSDGTQSLDLGPDVDMICHLRNLGTSGSAATAFEFGIDRAYDWVFVFDVDSNPRPDALRVLVEYYEGLSDAEKVRVGMLSCLSVDVPTGAPYPGLVFTPGGPQLATVPSDQSYYECDAIAWTGSLFSLRAVEDVGLPRFGLRGSWDDLALDYGDLEFCYRLRDAGYKITVHTKSIVDHNIGRLQRVNVLGKFVYSSNHSAERRYLYFRNMVYYWLYLYPNPRKTLQLSANLVGSLLKKTVQVLVMESGAMRTICACWKGAWHGLTRNVERPMHLDHTAP